MEEDNSRSFRVYQSVDIYAVPRIWSVLDSLLCLDAARIIVLFVLRGLDGLVEPIESESGTNAPGIAKSATDMILFPYW